MATYQDPWVDDGWIWAYYNVTTTEAATSVIYNTTSVSEMEVDGVSITVAASYQFSTTGEHLVKFKMSGNSLSNRQFRQITSLVRMYLPDSITEMGGGNGQHFYHCTGLTFFRFPAHLTNISYQGFTSCTNLVIKDLSLPEITSIGSNGFRFVNVTNIRNLGKVTEISSNYAFANNSSLTTVVLPATLTNIGNNAFNGCGTIASFTCLGETPPTISTGAFNSATLTKIFVPAKSLQAYKSATGWSSWANKIFPLWEETPIAINHLSLGDFRRRIMIGISKRMVVIFN